MNQTTPVLLTVTLLPAVAAVAGCGEKEEPAVARPPQPTPSQQAGCSGRTSERRFTEAALLQGGRLIRIGYADSSSRRPCSLRVRHDRSVLRVTLTVANPRVQTSDLLPQCAEGRLSQAVPPDAMIVTEARGESKPVDPLPPGESGRDCVRVPVDEPG